MRVAIATDHAGFCQKEAAIKEIEKLGHTVCDLGPKTEESVDYPAYAHAVAHAVASGKADAGVLICGTGLGMALSATKVPNIRAVAVQTPEFARLSREHNDANVLCLSGRFVTPETNQELIRIFLTTEFAGGRHAKRVQQMEDC